MPAGVEKRVLALVGEVMGLMEIEEFSAGLLIALRETIPSDWTALNEVPADRPRPISLTEPVVPPELHTSFARYAEQNPIAAHFIRTRDGRATRMSDLVTRRELHQLELYREVYAPIGLEYQMAITLPSEAGRILGVALSRCRRDFTVAERTLLNLARPYLIQAYRNALAYSRLSTAPADGATIAVAELEALGLTQRQAQVLRLVAMGRSDRDAGAELGIGARTVQKHLERVYRTLGVDNRSQAAQRAWDLVLH